MPCNPNACRAVLLGACLSLVYAAGAEDWPAYQNDAARSAVSRQELVLPLGTAWVHQTDARPRAAWPDPGRTANMLDFDRVFQPVAAGGIVYFGSSEDDTLYALNAADGSIRWTFTAGGPIRFAPHVADGRCFFASDDGVIYCVDARTGTTVWTFSAAPENRMIAGNGRMISRWPCRSGVLVHEGTVYATAGIWPSEGTYYYAIDAETGEQKWCNDTLNAMYLAYPHDGTSFGGPTPQGYLVTDGEVLVVPTGESAPAVLDAANGELLYWHPQRPGSTWAALGDGFVMVAGRGWQPDQELRLGEAPLFRGDGVAFYDLSSGEVTGGAKWRSYDRLPGSARHQLERWRGQVSPIGGRDRAVLSGDRLYTSGMGVIEALDCSDDPLNRLWQIEHPPVYCLTVVGSLLLAGSDGLVSALSSEDGTVLWRGRVNGQARGIAVASGVLYVATDEGALYAFASGRPARSPAPRRLQDDRPLTGFALVVGHRDTTVAEQVAASEAWNVICLLPDEASVSAARRRLLGRGYGRNLVVHLEPPDGRLPYADFFANRVFVSGGAGGVQPEELYRVLHPCTGRLQMANMSGEAMARFVQRAGIPAEEVYQDVVRRGPLEGAFDWNTTAEADQRVSWPLELLWFGGPGRQRTLARHRQDLPPPVAAFGRCFFLGDGHVMAIDAYHGLELWSRPAGRYRYVSADEHHAYIGLGGRVMQCDAQTGRLEKVFGQMEPISFPLVEPQTFHAGDGEYRAAITVARSAAALELTLRATTPLPDDKDSWTLWFDFREADQRLLPAGLGRWPMIINTASATLRRFDGFGGAVLPEVHLSRVGDGVRLEIPFAEIRRLTGRTPEDFDLSAEIALYRGFDVRLRSRPITEGRDPWQDGTATFVLGRAEASSASPLAGVARAELSELPPHARDWGRMPLHVRHDGNIPRPALAARATPQLRQRINPITGELNPRDYLRGYGCSGTIASATMDFFRSGTIGMYDLADDSGMRNFAGVRPGCRITLLPALGVLVSAEGVGDCFCTYNFSTSLALAPAPRRSNEDWALFVDQTRPVPMHQLALNLGAPGDRRDDAGVLWLGYPRQPMMFATGGSFGARANAFGLPVALEMFDGGRTIRVNAERVPIADASDPWIPASGAVGIRSVSMGTIYNEPNTTCLALPVTAAPVLDGALEDAAWRGEPGLPLASGSRNPTDRARVRVRFDEQNLYFAYEQQPALDRRGVPLPWTGASFDVLLKDVTAAAYARFAVSADGVKSSDSVSAVVPVPRVNGTRDGRLEDTRTVRLDLGSERGTMRLGWNDGGLRVLMKVPAATADTALPNLRAQFANLESPAIVEAVVDRAGQSVVAVQAVFGDAASNRSATSNGSEQAVSELLEAPDLSTKELGYFRGSQPLAAAPTITAGDDWMSIDMTIPFDQLKLQPAAGAMLGLQIVAYDPSVNDQNISGGGGARRSLFRSGSVLSLSLQGSDVPAAPIAAVGEKREWFGSTAVFAATVREIPADAWSSAVVADGESFRAELAVPLQVLQSAGLSRERLLAQFLTDGSLSGNLDLLYNRFRTRSVRLHTSDVPQTPPGYSLRLHFAELEDKQPGERIFDIRLQGRLVAESLDIADQAGGPRRLLTKTFPLEPGTDFLIEFLPKKGEPLLNALELIRDDQPVRDDARLSHR